MPTPITAGAPSNIQKLRDIETKAMANGSLSSADVSRLQKTAQTKDEKALVGQMLQRDAFDSSVSKSTASSVTNRSPVVGQKVGNTTVTRDFSPPEGFEDRNQAIGAAGLAGNANAAVVQDAKGKWHAVQTKEALTSSSTTALPIRKGSDAQINTARENYRKLADTDPQALKDGTIAAAKALASLTLGVPESEINPVRGSAGLDANKLNLNVSQRAADGDEGQTDKKLAVNGRVPTSITMSAVTNSSTHASTVLFHEGVHASDHERTLALKQQFDGLSPKPMKDGQPMSFNYWLSTQATAHPAQAGVFEKSKLDDSSTSNEMHAHMQTFMHSFRADPQTALGELTELNRDFKSGEGASEQLNASQLRSFFFSLSPSEQKTFRDVFNGLPDGAAKGVFKKAFPEGIR
jgi:hypothetical protein